MHILIAPNAFKNSLTAQAAAEAIQKGLQLSKLQCTHACFPIADGGDGTGELIVERLAGERVSIEAHDALGREISCSYGLVDNLETAVIEMAAASGLRLLRSEELNPLHATSFGTGELIKDAIDRGVKKVIIGMGGSATVDGGSGILKALGVRFLNKPGAELINLPEDLIELDRIDLSGLDERCANCDITILCDVDNRLLGDAGAAAVFGPQKGATPIDVKKLEQALAKFREITLETTGKDMAEVKYGGTAGGAAAGLYAILNAKLVNGAEHFLKLTNFIEYLKGADLVITGEGSIDEQTLQGKGPFGVALMAKERQVSVIGLAGKVPLVENTMLKQYFNVLLAIGNMPADITSAMANTAENLTRVARELGDLLAISHKGVSKY